MAAADWPNWTAREAQPRPPWPRAVRKLIGAIGEDLLDRMLSWSPTQRPSALEAFSHGFLRPDRLALHQAALFFEGV